MFWTGIVRSSGVPIFGINTVAVMCILQSDVPIDLLDVEKNSAVVSYSACSPEVKCQILVHIDF